MEYCRSYSITNFVEAIDMRVLMFGWEYPPFISGGLGTACYGLTRGLLRKKVAITFVVPRLSGAEPRQNLRFINGSTVRITQENGVLLKRFRMTPIDAFLLPYMTEDSYKSALKKAIDEINEVRPFEEDVAWEHYGPDMCSEVFRYARVGRIVASREPCDVIHVHDWMTIPAGVEAKDETGKPLVVHIHSLETDRKFMRLNERIYGIERSGMMGADHIITVSHYTKRKIVGEYRIPEEKVSVVHNAVTRSEWREKLYVNKDDSRKYVLFLGRITSQKGPDYFVEAARKIVLTNPDIHFIMAGAGDMLDAVKRAVIYCGLEEHVHFTGFLRGSDVERAYAISDLYVMPSVSEPFGITALEAVSCDVPVIISKQSGVSEVLKKCPRVDFWNTDVLADTVIEILSDDTRRDEIVRACKKELKQLSWQIAAEKIINVYRRLIVI